MRWYRLAAEQGHTGAQYNLSIIYSAGKGVVQDDVMAHVWFNLAAAQGTAQAAENREIIANQMTPAKVMEAQGHARE